MAFDITSVLGDIAAGKAARSTDQRRELRYIPLHLIDANPKNQYSMEGIEDLAANIELFGLMQPLVVREEACGRYMLISGHRRRAALRMLAEHAESYPDSMHEPVACMVESGADLPGIEAGGNDEIAARAMVEELQLIFANSDTRVLSSADTAQQVRRIRELFTGLQDLGYKFPGRLRDHVAAAAKVSATRVARLDVIDKNLVPAFRTHWQNGLLGETSAYEIARRDPAIQKLAAERVNPTLLAQMSTDQVTAILEACEADKHEEKEIRDDWNRNVTKMAEASGTASTYNAENYLARMEKEDALFREMLEDPEMLTMFVKDLGGQRFRSEAIAALKEKHRSHGGSFTRISFDGSAKGLKLRRHSPADKRTPAITRTWTDVYDMLCLILLQQANRKPKEAMPEAMSAADTGPGLAWSTGTPTERGVYETRIGLVQEETPQTASWQRLEWIDGGWVYPAIHTPLPAGAKVYRWHKLPEL